MDMLSPAPPKKFPSKQHWPQSRAERGQAYGTDDPIHAGDKLVVMLNDTWLDYGTSFEKLRRENAQAIAAGHKLKVAYDIAIKELADLREKHNNLRAAEKRRRMAAAGFKS